MVHRLIATLVVAMVFTIVGKSWAQDELPGATGPLATETIPVSAPLTERIGAPRWTLRGKYPEIALQPRQHTTEKSYRKALVAGLITGAALGAVEGAMLGRTVGEEGATVGMAFIVAGLGGVTGGLTGITVAALPQRTGWKRHVQAAAVGLVISGLGYRAFGAWIDDPGLGAREFGRTGLVHGALTGVIVIEIGIGR